MAKPQYNAAHQRARKQALAELVDGTPCHFCGRPMFRWQRLELDHLVPVKYGGKDGPKRLAHQHCNSAAGARLANRSRRLRRKLPKKRRVLPRWL